jgi:uncharacterized repeat protein (TIGR01451 family)
MIDTKRSVRFDGTHLTQPKENPVMISPNSIRAVIVSAFAAAALFLSGTALKGQARIDGLPPGADLAVTKVGSPNPVNAGSDVTYTITVSNGGPDAAINAALNDALPTGMTFVSLASPAGWTCSTPAPGAGGSISCTHPSLPVGGDDVFTLVSHVPTGTAGGTIFTNTALVSAGTFDPNGQNNSASASNTVAGADLEVTKVGSPDPVSAGSDLTYTITVSNGGPAIAIAAALNDALPAGLTFVSLASPAGWTCSTPAPGAGGSVSCTNPSLAVGSQDVFTLVSHVPAGTPAGTTFTNTALVSASTFDPNDENNSSSAANTVTGPVADMGVFKQASAEEVLADSNVTYTIQVVNGGPSNAVNATLSDTLPGNMTFVSLSVPAGWTCSNPAPGAGGAISCSNPSLAPNGNDVFTLLGHVPAGTPAGTIYTNTASVSSSTFDPSDKNNSSTVSTTVVNCLTNPVVTTNATSGPGSLRQAILDACPGSTITFDMSQVVSPITLISGQLVIDKNLTITGPGANVLTVQRGTGPKVPFFRVFNVTVATGEGFGAVTISGLTIANGRPLGSFPSSAGGGVSNSGPVTLNVVACTLNNNVADFGGGIFNFGAGTINITDSTLNNNTANFGGGGGIYNSSTGNINLTNSTLSGNIANNDSLEGGTFGTGGAIANNSSGPVNVANSTLTGNSSDTNGGGIANNSSGVVQISNSIVALNTATTSGPDLSGTFTANYTFVGNPAGATINGGTGNLNGNPQLGPLANNGGPTQTHLPQLGSTAIDAGDPAFAPPPDGDQRGLPRVTGPRLDMGAVETNYTLTATAGTPQSTAVNTTFPANLQATVAESGTPVAGVQVTFTPPASGPSGTFAGGNPAIATTNGSGVATAPAFTANGIAGSYDVAATAAGIVTPATFSLTNIAATPTPTPATPTPTPATPTPTPATPTPTPATPTPTPATPTPTPATPTPTPETPTPTPATPTPTPTTPTPTPPAPTPTPTPTPTTHAINLSTRMLVQTGDRVGIGGFIITGSGPKHVLIRGIGPSLTRYGIVDVLADPVLELHGSGSFATITNDNWRDTQEVQIAATGIPPTNDFESAIDATLVPGAYTALVRGKNNSSGVALIEVYDLDQDAPSRLANLSTRAFVSIGNDIVIAGFFLSDGNGSDRIIVRGMGPSLSGFGLSSVLADPTLEVRNSNGSLVLTNNDWQDNAAQAAELTAAGLAPTNSLEAAIAATLPPDLYTALLAGLNNGTGIGVVEVYDRGP